MCVGVKDRENDVVTVAGLAAPAQTSGIFEYPHEIHGQIDTSQEHGKRVKTLECKCAAGKSMAAASTASPFLYI